MHAIRSALTIALPILLASPVIVADTAPAFAQSTSISAGTTGTGSAGGAATGDLQTTRNRNQPAPVGTVLGVPVVITSPLDAPYNAASAYTTYEGQSGFGPNAVLAAGDAGSP